MADASNATFIYVTFIRTTPERLWSALTSPEFTRKYWYGTHQESDWEAGSPWRLVFADGRVADTGEVVEIDPPRRLVLNRPLTNSLLGIQRTSSSRPWWVSASRYWGGSSGKGLCQRAVKQSGSGRPCQAP